MNEAKLSEKLKVNAEVLGVTSAAGTTSLNYDMQMYDRALLVTNVQGNFIAATLDLMQSSASTVAGTSAAGGKAGIVLGGAATLVPVTGGVREITITHDAGTTSEPFYFAVGGSGFKTLQYTSSTASLNSSAWDSTRSYYGSTVASSANTGSQFAMDSLKTALASTLMFGNIFSFSTPTTASLVVKLLDEASGSIGFQTTAAIPVPTVMQAVGAFDIMTEDLATTAGKRFVSVKCSTATTSCDVGVTVIRSGGRYNPPAFSGLLSS